MTVRLEESNTVGFLLDKFCLRWRRRTPRVSAIDSIRFDTPRRRSGRCRRGDGCGRRRRRRRDEEPARGCRRRCIRLRIRMGKELFPRALEQRLRHPHPHLLRFRAAVTTNDRDDRGIRLIRTQVARLHRRGIRSGGRRRRGRILSRRRAPAAGGGKAKRPSRRRRLPRLQRRWITERGTMWKCMTFLSG